MVLRGEPQRVLSSLEKKNIHFLLYTRQIVLIESSVLNAIDYKMVIPKMVSCPSSVVNFVLEPRHSYSDLCGDSFKEYSVERGIEQLFSIKTLRLTEVLGILDRNVR